MKRLLTTPARVGLTLGLALVLAASTAGPGMAVMAEHGRGGSVSDDAVLAWNGVAGEAAVAACIAPTENPLHESRAYAMMHIAVHDALNAIDRRYEPYAYREKAKRSTSPEAAVAAAARSVLVPALLAIPAPFPPACGEAGAALVEERYAAALGSVPDGPAKEAGVAVGQAAAAAILALRAQDGSDTPLVDAAYVEGTTPGAWRFTPGVPFAFATGWGGVTPFALTDAAQFRPEPPPDVTSRRYARDFREVQRLGGDGVTTASERTPDQTQSALFWVESSPLAWNRIARTVADGRDLDAWASARLFGLLNIALADGYVSSFATKWTYAFWRPVTAIREGDADGNRRTAGDPTWTPLVTTPPIPDYESAHAVEGAAAVAVLRGVLRTDRISFSTCSLTLPAGQTCADPTPVLREFRKLSRAAKENAESRILNGFHFRTAIEVGLDVGEQVGEHAVATVLRRTR